MKELRMQMMEVARLTADNGFHDRQKDVLSGDFSNKWFPVPCVTESPGPRSVGHIIIGEATIARAMYRHEVLVNCRVVDDDCQAAISMDRRNGAPESVVALVDHLEKLIKRKEEIKRTGGRPLSPRGDARKRVARWIGLTESAIRQMEVRASSRKPKPEKKEWALECYGFEAAPGLLERAAKAKRAARAAIHAISRAKVFANEIAEKDLEIHSGLIKSECRIKDLEPYALCPWCKSTVSLMPTCYTCHRLGWVTKNMFDGAPRELKKNPWVAHNGNFLDMYTMRPPITENHPMADFGPDEDYIEEEEPPL